MYSPFFVLTMPTSSRLTGKLSWRFPSGLMLSVVVTVDDSPLVEDVIQFDGGKLRRAPGAFPRLACIQKVDSPLVVLALHGFQETDDGTLRRASTQRVVVGGLGLCGPFQRCGRLCLLGGRAPVTRQAASITAMAIRIENMVLSFPGFPFAGLLRKSFWQSLETS